jgi:hypothetical protein
MSINNLKTVDYNKELIKSKSFANKENTDVQYLILETIKNDGCNESEALYRSVIVRPDNNTVLSYSPPMETELSVFKTKYPDLSKLTKILPIVQTKFIINEMIEGIMVHLFYDPRISSWEIATKSAIGGKYWYFRTQYSEPINNIIGQPTANIKPINDTSLPQMTFRDMFLEALNLTEAGLTNLDFNKKNCYNFILQHPHNHIVFQITKPTIYLVNVYEIMDNNDIRTIPQSDYEDYDFITRCPIKFPRQFTETDYDTLFNKYCSINSNYPSNCSNSIVPLLMGIMITNSETGERTSIKNRVYETNKEIRGNNPNLQFQYYCLCRMNKVHLFLDLFPEYKFMFAQFKTQTEDYITNLHQSYFKQYVAKDYSIPISPKYRTHIYKIHHEIFIPSKQLLNKIVITRKIVREYFDNLDPKTQLYLVNL